MTVQRSTQHQSLVDPVGRQDLIIVFCKLVERSSVGARLSLTKLFGLTWIHGAFKVGEVL